jgi:glycosyltransferase involved in cell wall biosynthesis
LSARTDKLSILHFAAPARFGGLESVLRQLAVGSSRRGHEVAVALILSPGDVSHPLVAELRAQGVSVVAVHVGDRNYLGERAQVRALCRRVRPDIVHTHGYRCDVVDGAVARREGIPVVSTCHGFIESNWRGRWQQWLQRRALRHFNAVVAVSSSIESKLEAAGVPKSRIHLVRNAAPADIEYLSRDDARRSLGIGNGQLIGWVGRLSDEKGPDVALDAFARLDGSSARIVFIGSGRDGAQLRERAATLGIDDRVIWCGAVREAARLYRAFDAFLISSRTEGTPMALLEAIGAGVPIVATRVGGIPAVVDSSCACLVESEDVVALGRALSETLNNSNLAAQRAENARKRVAENFSVDGWLRAYDSVYYACVNGSARNRRPAAK